MSCTSTFPSEGFSGFDTAWPQAHAWAIEQMPCPAYCCGHDGSILHCNAAAIKLWGTEPALGQAGAWTGFAALYAADGDPIARDAGPAALAVAGHAPGPTECIARSVDGHVRYVVVHAKTVADAGGRPIGAICSLTDISDKRHLQARVQDTAATRDDFLTMLAHELRNPLAPMMSVAGLLRARSADPAIAKMAFMIERQTRKLARFIHDLLDASRIDRVAHINVEPRPCELDAVLSLALDTVEGEIAARHQRLVMQGDDRKATLHCDPDRVAQALGNVLANASAFTRDGGEFHLRVEIDRHTLHVEVTDSGEGIAPHDLPHVFTPFERRAVAPGRAPSGAGLGLTLAQGVCQAHGGTIRVGSEGLGKGVAVSIDLPIVDAPPDHRSRRYDVASARSAPARSPDRRS